jgi:SOS response regulatory protein OraA/RecX
MGRERLKAELLNRGFEDSVAERALRQAYRSISEQELACQALEGAGEPDASGTVGAVSTATRVR